MRSCVIVGSAPFTDAAALRQYVPKEAFVIAADGGQRLLDEMYIPCDLIVGDFDSSDSPVGSCAQVITLPTHKDDTDVLAAIRIALEKGYKRFILLGCIGGRFDHTIANVFLLRFLYDHGAEGVLIDEDQELRLLGAGTHVVESNDAPVFSLFPYGGETIGVTIQNAAYTVENVTLDVATPIGISNEFLNDPVTISIKKGYLLLVLTKNH